MNTNARPSPRPARRPIIAPPALALARLIVRPPPSMPITELLAQAAAMLASAASVREVAR